MDNGNYSTSILHIALSLDSLHSTVISDPVPWKWQAPFINADSSLFSGRSQQETLACFAQELSLTLFCVSFLCALDLRQVRFFLSEQVTTILGQDLGDIIHGFILLKR